MMYDFISLYRPGVKITQKIINQTKSDPREAGIIMPNVWRAPGIASLAVENKPYHGLVIKLPMIWAVHQNEIETFQKLFNLLATKPDTSWPVEVSEWVDLSQEALSKLEKIGYE